jgi:DNA polymerase-3 subunit alpha
VFREVGNTTADQAEEFRRDIAKKAMKKVAKHKEVWMPGAIASLGKETAEELWASMETFGQYGFNKSHAISYVMCLFEASLPARVVDGSTEECGQK